MIKLKKLLKESSPGFTKREFGDPLPTFNDVMGTHQQIQEARFKADNGQGINAKQSTGEDGNPEVSYSPKDWGVLLTIELLEAMAEKLGNFTLSTSAGLELGKSDVKMIKGTKDGMWKHRGNEVTIKYWASYR